MKSTIISLLLLNFLLPFLLFRARAAPSPEMGTEMSRRIIWGMLQGKYISYEVLRRNMVPCDRPGAPYYSCRAGGDPKANPYVRGCSMITGCRGDIP